MKKLVLSVLVVLAGTTLFAQDATKNDAKKAIKEQIKTDKEAVKKDKEALKEAKTAALQLRSPAG